MVAFVSTVSFPEYVTNKIAGPKPGLWLSRLLGGVVSSTTVTLSFSQRSKEEASLTPTLC